MRLDLDPIKALCEGATAGPWESDGSEIVVAHTREWIAESLRTVDTYGQGNRDAAFIAAARAAVPALVAEVERLWALLEKRSEVGGSRPLGMTAAPPQRPDECPDAARHARPRALGDQRPETRFRCPSCGFWCLLAPADPDDTRPNRAVDLMAALEASLAAAKHPACEPCQRGQGITQPGPGHCKNHDRHCSAAPCW